MSSARSSVLPVVSFYDLFPIFFTPFLFFFVLCGWYDARRQQDVPKVRVSGRCPLHTRDFATLRHPAHRAVSSNQDFSYLRGSSSSSLRLAPPCCCLLLPSPRPPIPHTLPAGPLHCPPRYAASAIGHSTDSAQFSLVQTLKEAPFRWQCLLTVTSHCSGFYGDEG